MDKKSKEVNTICIHPRIYLKIGFELGIWQTCLDIDLDDGGYHACRRVEEIEEILSTVGEKVDISNLVSLLVLIPE